MTQLTKCLHLSWVHRDSQLTNIVESLAGGSLFFCLTLFWIFIFGEYYLNSSNPNLQKHQYKIKVYL